VALRRIRRARTLAGKGYPSGAERSRVPGDDFRSDRLRALTPAGRPAEPIEVAAVAGRFTTGGQWEERWRFSSLMRPPDDVPVTRFDIAQNGLTADVLRAQRAPGEVMAELDAQLADPPYRLVAHSAHTEAAAIGGQREHCPVLAATPLLCTVRLARLAYPGLPSHKLDELLRHLNIPKPASRHRALPDVELTIPVFREILAAGHANRTWATMLDLDIVSRAQIKPRRPTTADPGEQTALF